MQTSQVVSPVVTDEGEPNSYTFTDPDNGRFTILLFYPAVERLYFLGNLTEWVRFGITSDMLQDFPFTRHEAAWVRSTLDAIDGGNA